MSDEMVMIYHPDLTAEGSKDEPLERPLEYFLAVQESGWKRLHTGSAKPASKPAASESDEASEPLNEAPEEE